MTLNCLLAKRFAIIPSPSSYFLSHFTFDQPIWPVCEPGLDVPDSAACALTSHSQPLILYPSLITPAYYHPSSYACTSLHMIEVSMLLTVSYDEWVNSNRLKHDVSQPVETFLIRIVFALFTLLQRHHPLDPLAVRSVAHTQVRRESTEPVHTHIHRGIIPQLYLYLYCWSRYTGHTIKRLYATSTLCTHIDLGLQTCRDTYIIETL